MTDAPLNHPGDETLRAMSLGQLTEQELAHVSAHLGDCPSCCQRIDQLATDDRLLARLQESASSQEEVLVPPAQRRAAVRVLRRSHEARSATRQRASEAAPVSLPASSQVGDHDTPAEVGRGGTGEPLAFLEPCDTPDRLGLLAHYEILEILGHGGMGLVLRGLDVQLNRVVAVKVVSPRLAADAMARQRFRREGQAAAAVSHPHVITIHAVDEFNGLPYLVMEYISGPSLQQKIDAGGALSLARILRIGTQIASGLAAAHAHGLVHRDIKPANILLENGIERVKITDFGLARSIDDVRMTQAGAVYGTPQYMSPEQAQGERVDQRSDLFSLGSVMYAMCTGRPPFRGDTSLAVLKRVCEETPRPIREVNPDIPEPLVEIVNRLLAKNPDARFQTAGEVAELLGRYLAHVQHDPLAPFQRIADGGLGITDSKTEDLSALQPAISNPPSGQPQHRPARSRLRRPLLVGAATLLLGVSVLAALEGAGITNLTGQAEPIVARGPEEPALPGRLSKPPTGGAPLPVKVFVLAGDYNMAGRAKVSLLKYQANQPGTKERFQHLLHDGEWVVREDVWIKNFQQKGNLTVGFGHTPDRFGPELEFGHVVGDHFDEQVLLIKTCCGDSLNREFRPPSASPPPREVLEQRLSELQKANPDATLADVERSYGSAYREMVKEVRDTLANLGAHFPGYQGQGSELTGFVWFQAWNDIAGANYDPRYAEHLAHFIRDVRRDFQTPHLPFVIGQLGARGVNGVDPNDLNIRGAQAAVAQLAEFRGNVKLVATDPYWDHEALEVYKKGTQEHRDEWDKIGSDAPYRYLGSARTFCSIGRAFGEAMIELHRRAK